VWTEIRKIPRFEAWSAGEPSAKLFLKNLSSKVTEVDLRFIFNRYSKTPTGEDVQVNLMTKGKMHGQAFVTLPDRDTATRALDQVLGYVLHDRPIIMVRVLSLPFFQSLLLIL